MSASAGGAIDYRTAGVTDQDDALASVSRHLGPTLRIPEARTLTGFGHFASVLELTPDLALALCTDGVGTKTIVAARLGRYDTVGFDCVAMNVNDLVCVGARPLALVDYIGVHTLDAARSDAILAGLGRAARAAGIAIPGGETAQLPELVGAPDDDAAFDLVGTAVGTLHPRDVITGDAIVPGDVIVGLASSGIHSNGLTLARRALLDEGAYRLDDEVAALGRTLGDELLEPTRIYVEAATALWDAGIATHGLAHITGGGLTNLLRLRPTVGFTIDALPDPPAIFGLIQAAGRIPDAEMFRVFNMGVGFVAVVAERDAAVVVDTVTARGFPCALIGRVTEPPAVVRVDPAALELAD